MTTLKAGDKAPAFEAPDQNGNILKLSDFNGSKLVLYFYPKDSTPGCTAEACNLRDHHDELLKQGYRVVGVSTDSRQSHLKFITRYDLPFPLIADTAKDLVRAYGVYGPKKFMGRTYEGIHRTTFLIDEQGMIERVITDVNTKKHTAQILQ